MKLLSLWLPDAQYHELSTLCLIKEQNLNLVMRLCIEAYLQENRSALTKNMQSLKHKTAKTGVVIRPEEEDAESDDMNNGASDIGIIIN